MPIVTVINFLFSSLYNYLLNTISAFLEEWCDCVFPIVQVKNKLTTFYFPAIYARNTEYVVALMKIGVYNLQT